MDSLWLHVRRLLKQRLNTDQFSQWIAPLKCTSQESSELFLETPSRFHYDWIQEHYLQLVQSCCGDIDNTVRVHLTIPESRPKVTRTKYGKIETMPFTTSFQTSQTFENYIVASFNRFAFTAAQYLSQCGNSTFNPLFIEGPAGLGKTHLLNAIGNKWPGNVDGAAVYLSCRDFIGDNPSLPANQPQITWQTLALIGVILVDDVHLLPAEGNSQRFLLDLFNRCYHAQKQMVFTANLLPYQISDLSAALQSRLGWGLIARIRKPDPQGFQKVIKGILTAADVTISPEVSHFLSKQQTPNFHAVQDSVNKLQDFVESEGNLQKLGESSLSVADNCSKIPEILTVHAIQQHVAINYRISPEALSGVAKSRPLVFARQVGMYLTRKLMGMTYTAIGGAFGGRDHSTVIYACRKVRAEMRRNQAIAERIVEIEKKILNVCKQEKKIKSGF